MLLRRLLLGHLKHHLLNFPTRHRLKFVRIVDLLPSDLDPLGFRIVARNGILVKLVPGSKLMLAVFQCKLQQQLQQAQALIQKLTLENGKHKLAAGNKLHENAIAGYNAETQRIKVTGEQINDANELQAVTRGEVQQMMFEMAQQQAAQQHQMALQQQAAAQQAPQTPPTGPTGAPQ